MTDILERICAHKRNHVAAQRSLIPLKQREREAVKAPPVRRFIQTLSLHRKTNPYTIIAEIKKASPSQGVIRQNFDPLSLAKAYVEAGAACLSVVTDQPYFQGEDEHLITIRKATPLPILRKDFLLDPYQIVESRALGADCVLIILAAVDDETAMSLISTAHTYELDVLIEVHDPVELQRALQLPIQLIGINNRNLKTLSVNLSTTERLAPLIPSDRLVVSESGFSTRSDLERIKAVGVDCFLIGESLLRQNHISNALHTLLKKQIQCHD